jgi:nucleotide-binding universal stress UspA family protein
MADASEKWMLAHDFSASADEATKVAADELQSRGGTLLIGHAFYVPMTPAGLAVEGAGAVLGSDLALRQQIQSDVEKTLENIENNLKKSHPNLKVETEAVEGTPVDALLELAHARSVNRLVVGTHARRGVTHFLLGSVAEHLVRLSPIPVLVVKSAEQSKALDERLT